MDINKALAAYAAAVKHRGQPTVVLAETVKGYGIGETGEGMNVTHQRKKMDFSALKGFRDRFNTPVPVKKIVEVPFYRPADDSIEIGYLKERRAALGGSFRSAAARPQVSLLATFDAQLKGSNSRELSTTVAFVRLLSTFVRDKNVGQFVVPLWASLAPWYGAHVSSIRDIFRKLGIYRTENADQLSPSNPHAEASTITACFDLVEAVESKCMTMIEDCSRS